jgi:flagellar hook-associated protein 2
MAGIQMSGLASGLDTQSIISQLMAVEALPRTIITNKQAAAQARQTALQDIQTKLSSLNLATTALSSVTTWGNSQTVDSSDATKATVRTVAGAPPGGHQLVVTQLARGAQATYAYSPPATAGSVTVNGLAVDVPVGATLDQAVVAINEAGYPDGQGVFAVNVNGQLAISSRTTGSASQAVVTGLGTQVGSGVAGADATGSVDGVAFTSSSNVVTAALPGVEMTLKAATDSTGISINVGNPGPSADAVVNAAKAFVSAYNSVVDAVRSRTTEARVPNPANASDAAKGSLFGDSGLSSMLDSLRRTLGTLTGGSTDALRTLSDLGISTGTASGTINSDSVAGKLTLDEDKLRSALSTDPTAVKRVLTGTASSPNGFAQAFSAVLSPYSQAGGAISGRLDAAASELSDLADSLTRFDDRMTAKQNILQKQFTALETAMQANNDTLARVQAQFGASSG